MFQENCYVVSSEHEAVIIDCGAFFEPEREAIVSYINDNNLTLTHLIATHGHIDHNFGINTIHNTFGIDVEVHADDETLMKALNAQAEVFCGASLNYPIPPIRRFLTDGESITVGEHSLKVIHTPGHSAGSIVLHCAEVNMAFTGDTLFHMSVGRTDLDGGSTAALKQSLAHLLTTLPDDTTILPGHGPSSTIFNERHNNPYL